MRVKKDETKQEFRLNSELWGLLVLSVFVEES